MPAPPPEPPRPPLTFERNRPLPVPAAEAFAWHERPGALTRLAPPWEDVSVESATGGLREGAEVVLKLKLGPAALRWHALHTAYEDRGPDGGMFRDVQTRGPFAFWEHTHLVKPGPDGTSDLKDQIRYLPPGGALGKSLGRGFVKRRLEALFAYRQALTAADLAAHHRFRDRPRLKVLISGAGGLIGRHLAAFLTGGGHEVTALSRSPADERTIHWNPAGGEIEADRLPGFDAVIHLAGESIQGRWTAAKKRKIHESRADGTRLLCGALADLPNPPKTLLSASAIGFYGDRGDDLLTEASAPGEGFLPEVCRAWEAAADPARGAGVRVVHPRIGVVLTPEGGALGAQLPIFKAGAGGPAGGGDQWVSWIGRDDVVGALHHALMTPDLSGPVNLTAPGTVTNEAFAGTLGEVLRRPALLPVPAFAVRLALGEMGEELLLAGARVKPAKLLKSGYTFRHAGLEPALRYLLGRT